jgi:hypothetical protein
MTREDENRLEGLRDADKKAAIEDSRTRHGLTASMYTRENWNSMDGPSTRFDQEEHYNELKKKALEKSSIPNEGDYLPGMTSREMYPVVQRNENVGTQFIEHVNKISRRSELRPSKDYTTILRPGLTDEGTKMSLYHIPSNDVVGDVAWKSATGHVEWLGVEHGHRHMTSYLVAQAWNHARTKGELGPASSAELSPDSRKIMAKYNPDSSDYRRNQGLDPNTVECPTCEGTGHGIMHPVSRDEGRTVQYHYSDGSGRVNIPEAPNTEAGRKMGIGYALQEEPGAHTMGHFDNSNAFLHPESGSSHYWPDISHFCRNCGGTGSKMAHE